MALNIYKTKMGLFNLFKKPAKPYKNQAYNIVYEMLFCDKPDLYKSSSKPPYNYPWNILFSDSVDFAGLHQIIADDNVESRIKILAYNKLRNAGQKIDKKELLAVIVEVGIGEGVDVLASFPDGTARYINHKEAMIILEATDEASNQLTEKLFADGLNVIKKIGPWNESRRPPVGKETVRLTFLVSDGLYFGEGPINVLFNDPLASPTLNSATALMKYLMDKVGPQN